MKVNGWEKIKDYPRFTIWRRIRAGYCECFDTGVTPPARNYDNDRRYL